VRRALALFALLALASTIGGVTHAQGSAMRAVGAPRVLESFDDVRAFSAVPSDGVRLVLRADPGVEGQALRMEFDYQGHAGYAVARRAFSLPVLPPHFAITLWVRGSALPNTLELKLVDSTGTNVWWLRRPELLVTAGWTRLRFRSTDLAYAWGPIGGGAPRGIAALEIAFTAGQGGHGWIALDNLTLTPLAAPVADSVPPRMMASTSASGTSAQALIGAHDATSPTASSAARAAAWRSGADGRQSLALDFGGTRQLSALMLDWSTTDWAMDYDIEGSDDGHAWTLAHTVRGSASGRRFVHLPRMETSRLRLVMRRSSRGKGYALDAIRVLSDSAAFTRSAFLERVAQASAPGRWPRPLSAQQSYWTVIGLPFDARDALFSEDGSVESRPGSFSLEPSMRVDGRILTWNDGTTTHALDGGSAPISTARRTTGDIALATTGFVGGTIGQSVVWTRYRVVNGGVTARVVELLVAVRPVQVNPPWQFLGTPGGAASIRAIRWTGRALVVNDTDVVVPVTPPSGVSVATFDAGPSMPDAPAGLASASVVDSTGFADGMMRWHLAIAAHDSADVWVAMPAPGVRVHEPVHGAATPHEAARTGDAELTRVRSVWARGADGSEPRIHLPRDGAALAATLRTALAHIRINANGPAIQPGTRSYRRSWIRDGALTSAALLRMGHRMEVGAFLDWYVPRVFADGKVPCCVDARGADPVTENDADGELLYLAAEYHRFSRGLDTVGGGSVARHWPTLRRVALHLDSLRQSRRTAMYRGADSLFVFGLLPPSISHEGYSSKAAYSYWDDWWGVRGLDDAAELARAAHDSASEGRFAAAAREMRTEVVASVRRSMALHRMETLPGAAELGDTDPTSATVALDPAQALADLPRRAVEATFDSAWATLQRRMAPASSWDIFTPYEWRDVGAYLRLGQPERAHAYATWLMSMRRPLEWNQWSEAVWREPRTPRFIGDMPHGWVASDFIRATLDMLTYERERDAVIVVAAGVPLDWLRSDSVAARGLYTQWGRLDVDVSHIADGARVAVRGAVGPGGLEVRAPFGRRVRTATVNGVAATLIDGGRAVTAPHAPAVVDFVY
jgi:hypothetical protein